MRSPGTARSPRAATALRKRHTAVLYAIRTLEEQTGFAARSIAAATAPR